MLAYILRRLALLVPTLLGVTAVVFFFMAVSPGGLGNIRARERGVQNAGVDVRRGIERDKRYYGMDLPIWAQYGRWINNISPVGFRTSDHLRWSAADQAAAREVLAATHLGEDTAMLDRGVHSVLDTAGYTGQTPKAAAQSLVSAMGEAVAGPLPLCPSATDAAPAVIGLAPGDKTLTAELFRRMRVEPYKWEEQKRTLAQALAGYGSTAAEKKWMQYYAGEITGRNRVVWAAPCIKWPDFGESQVSKRRVMSLFAEHLPVTLLLNILALPMIEVLGVFFGVKAASRPGGAFDVGSSMTFLLLWSVPTLVAATLLLGFFANPQFLSWFPTQMLHDPIQAERFAFFPGQVNGHWQRGWFLDTLWHMVLPILCMSYHGLATGSRIMRGATLDALGADYIRTARAKGVSDRNILWQHAFRNSMLPLITMLSGLLPAMLVGSFIVEYTFNIRGMGLLGVEAAKANDANVVLATTLLVSILVLLCDLARDVWYAMADPRVSYE